MLASPSDIRLHHSLRMSPRALRLVTNEGREIYRRFNPARADGSGLVTFRFNVGEPKKALGDSLFAFSEH